MRPTIPEEADFPAGTMFRIKEFDVPLAWIPGQGWTNWFGGRPRAYDVTWLRVDNHWPPTDFREWQGLIVASLPKKR